MIDWGVLVVPALIFLVVPLAIFASAFIPAYLRATGAIIVSAALAVIAFAALWLVLGGPAYIYSGPSAPVWIASFYGGILLALSAWILAMSAAVQARRWPWFALLLLAGYLTLAAIYASFSSVFVYCPTTQDAYTCPPVSPLAHLLLIAGYLVSPAADLVYSLRRPSKRVREAPEGLIISSLQEANPVEAE